MGHRPVSRCLRSDEPHTSHIRATSAPRHSSALIPPGPHDRMDLLIVEPLEAEVLQWLDARHELFYAPRLPRDPQAFGEALSSARAVLAAMAGAAPAAPA